MGSLCIGANGGLIISASTKNYLTPNPFRPSVGGVPKK